MIKADTVIDAGGCGLRTFVAADSADGRQVTFVVETECDLVARFAASLRRRQPLDVRREVDEYAESVILATGSQALAECRKCCAVPLGIFSAMRVAAGLALAGDVRIETMAEPQDFVRPPACLCPHDQLHWQQRQRQENPCPSTSTRASRRRLVKSRATTRSSSA